MELGAKAGFLGGRGSATIAVYRIVKQRLLSQRTPTSPVEQVGQRSSKGVEATLTLDLPAGWAVEANGTVLSARLDDFQSAVRLDGRTPANIPEATANLPLRWTAGPGFQGRAGLRYVGRAFSDDANRFRIPGYAVFNLSLSLTLSSRLAKDIVVRNLFDRSQALNCYHDEQWLLGRPRPIDVSLRGVLAGASTRAGGSIS